MMHGQKNIKLRFLKSYCSFSITSVIMRRKIGPTMTSELARLSCFYLITAAAAAAAAAAAVVIGSVIC